MSDATRYPLSWPTGWKRTAAKDRRPVEFRETTMVQRQGRGRWENGQWHSGEVTSAKGSKKITLPTARERLTDQLARLDAKNAIVSTNMELTRYGVPRADRAAPADPGVAVYFELHGKDRVLACDKWDSVAGNMAAIANHIDAIRRVDRYGVGTLDQAFAGYDALPPPGAANRPPWRKVLGIAEDENCSAEAVQAAYRSMAKVFHPDLQGGSHEAMAMLNEARDQALAETGGAS